MSAKGRGRHDGGDEDFRPVGDGWPGYFVGRDGHVYSDKLGERRRLAEGSDRDGYATVQLTRESRSTKFAIHRLVCRAFHGPRPTPRHEARHLDGDRSNAAASNLLWGTSKENAEDRERHGNTCRGEKNGGHKLTLVQVREIKRRLRAGETTVALGKAFKVAQGTIWFIKSGWHWSHV